MRATDEDVLTRTAGARPRTPYAEQTWDADSEEIWAHHPDGSRMVNLAGIVRRRAVATPDAVAISEPDRDTTFAELDARSSQVAQALLADGRAAGDRVVYLGVNSPSFLEVVYGAAKIGAIATPLNNRLAAPSCRQCWPTPNRPYRHRRGRAGRDRTRPAECGGSSPPTPTTPGWCADPRADPGVEAGRRGSRAHPLHVGDHRAAEGDRAVRPRARPGAGRACRLRRRVRH